MMRNLLTIGLLASSLGFSGASVAHADTNEMQFENETTAMDAGDLTERRGPGYPGGYGPVWRMYAYGGYYDVTGRIPGTQRLAQMRSYGGRFERGEPVPMNYVLCDDLGHICMQPGYGPPSFGACYNSQHYE